MLRVKSSLCLTALMSFFLLLGCQGGDQVEPLEVQYLEIWAPALNDTFEEIGREWAELNGRQVEFARVPLADLPQRVAEFVEVQGAANVAVLPATQAVIHRPVLVPMSEVVGELEVGGTPALPIAKAMNFSAGEWAAAPLYSWSHIWVWRGDWLAKAGLKKPRTLQEARLVMSELRRKGEGVYGFGIGLGSDDDAKMFTQSILWSYGGSVFDESGQVVLDSPEARQAFDYVLSLQRDGLLPPEVLGWDGASNNRAFLAGTIAGTANAPTILYALKREDAAVAEHLEHSLYPVGPAGRHTFATGFSLAIREGDPRAEEAKGFVRFVLQRENYRRLIEAGEGSVNPLYTGYEDLEIWKDSRLKVALESLQYEHPVGWPGPVSLAAAEVFERHVLTDIYGRVLNDKLTLEDALSEAHQRIEEIVARTEGRAEGKEAAE